MNYFVHKTLFHKVVFISKLCSTIDDTIKVKFSYIVLCIIRPFASFRIIEILSCFPFINSLVLFSVYSKHRRPPSSFFFKQPND